MTSERVLRASAREMLDGHAHVSILFLPLDALEKQLLAPFGHGLSASAGAAERPAAAAAAAPTMERREVDVASAGSL